MSKGAVEETTESITEEMKSVKWEGEEVRGKDGRVRVGKEGGKDQDVGAKGQTEWA
jgi:hypothetical protein